MNTIKVLLFLTGLLLNTLALADLNKGLIAHYSFDDCAATDNSGHGYNGVINGTAQCIDNKTGKAFNFLGAMDENIKIDNFPQINTNLTISALISPNQFKFGYNPIVTKGESATKEAYTLWAGYNAITLLLNWHSDKEIWCSASVKIKDNNFYHIAASYNYSAGKISLYLNGKYVGGCAYQNKIYHLAEPLYISSSYPGGWEYFSGIIDELRIYKRALSTSEIKSLYYQIFPPIISGTAPWQTKHSVVCSNLTQNTSITLPATTATAWDCEKAGLVVNHGDSVNVLITGTKY